VGNGTDAIHIALRCLGIGPGDKVITAANSFIGSSEPISMAGADVVFVDCDAETKNMDLNLLESMLAECRSEDLPKAIIPVHLYGQAMDMPRLMKIAHKYQLKVVEDCAQAHLAKCYDQCVGTYGDMACYSFYPGKNLGAMGDGGAVVTQSDKLADVARQFSNHGRSSKYAHEFEAVNSRLDGIQAAILKIKLRELPKWNLGRQKVAAKYKEVLRDIPQVICPKEQDGLECIYHLFVIETDQRDELRQHLSEDHIQTGIHYPIALPNLKAYQHLGFKEQDYPVSSGLEKRILSLPMFPELSEVSIERIGASIKRYFSKH
jgi:dTDP-4-amino-4,6-dideoxygalactose transaminase